MKGNLGDAEAEGVGYCCRSFYLYLFFENVGCKKKNNSNSDRSKEKWLFSLIAQSPCWRE